MSSSSLEDLVLEILRLSRRMRQEAGRGPSAAELAGYLHLPLAEVRAALARAKDLAARKGGGAGRGAVVPGGLDEALTAEEERVLCQRFGIERKPGQPALLQLDAATQANLRETLTRVLASLTQREREVLRMRFGIGLNTDHTLQDVGRQVSVTRERIRRIEAKARAKLPPKDFDDS